MNPANTTSKPGPTAVFRHIKRQSLRQQVRRSLTEAILSGELSPGDRVNETAVAEQLGVSQTPVREALLGLEERGFLSSRPRKGFFVRGFSERDVRDIYPVLASLEALALGSAGLPVEPSLADLRKINTAFRQAEDQPEQALDLDASFHVRLHAGCSNRYLLDIMERSRESAYRYELAYMREGGRVLGSADQHDSIIDALASGDLDLACEHLKANWLVGLDLIGGWLRAQQEAD